MPSEPLDSRHPDFPSLYTQWEAEFFYLPFFVDSRALIPRFETESLVREGIARAKLQAFDVLIDIGTGSGIIAVSLAKTGLFPRVLAVDLSQEALSLAAKNAERNHTTIEFLSSDLLSNIPWSTFHQGNRILIATNLPYIAQGSDEMSSDTVFEPSMALFGGEKTGFELYERLFSEIASQRLVRDDLSLEIMLEMWHDQEEIATKVLDSYWWEYRFFADPFGVRRFIHIILP